VYATAAGDSLQITLRLDGGSVASIAYLTEGNSRYPKETLDVHVDGSTGRLDNFSRVTVWSGRTKGGKRTLAGQDKGQRAQVAAFVSAVREGGPMPIDLESLVATTRATLAVEASLTSGQPVTW
jgi:predicted dehydrogenase